VASLFESEIREQPETLGRLVREGREEAERLGAAVREAAPRFVMLAARGSSDNAARYAQYLLGFQNRLSVALAAPSLFTHYQTPPNLAGALVVGISQSGQSPDVVEVVSEGRRQGALTAALSNDPASPLALAAEHCLILRAGEERAVAATKTYTAQLAALAMLSAAIAAREELWGGLLALPGQVRETIAAGRGLDAAARLVAPASRLVVVGRGLHLATAFEVALKIKETSYLTAEPFSPADFLHGPVAMLERDLPLLLVASGPRPFPELRELARRARGSGSPLLALADDEELLELADAPLPLAGAAPEWLAPVTAVVLGQLLALELCRARGFDPDAPRGLRKVTLTR
jgi:glucosamine--fructose-6-phosphate aminotransferase (isomerizing)